MLWITLNGESRAAKLKRIPIHAPTFDLPAWYCRMHARPTCFPAPVMLCERRERSIPRSLTAFVDGLHIPVGILRPHFSRASERHSAMPLEIGVLGRLLLVNPAKAGIQTASQPMTNHRLPAPAGMTTVGQPARRAGLSHLPLPLAGKGRGEGFRAAHPVPDCRCEAPTGAKQSCENRTGGVCPRPRCGPFFCG
jgi:hypothetical protein